jgi:transcriptional antiterminator
MDVDNTFIKPVLLFYFGKGLNEYETREEVTKKYGPYGISLKTINKWFAAFRKGKYKPINKSSKPDKRLTDEFLIELVNENPDLSMEKLARLADTSSSCISKRLKQINRVSERVKYVKKSNHGSKSEMQLRYKPPLSDRFIIDLVNDNPELSMTELATLAGTSQSTMSIRLRQINAGGEKVNYRNKVSKFSDEFLIDLINKNPDLNMKELAEIVHTSESAISLRIKSINKNGERVKYITKRSNRSGRVARQKPMPELTDEYLIDLIDKNPDLSMEKLARLAGRSPATICKRIKQLNSSGEGVKYISKKIKKDESIESKKPNSKTKISDEDLINLVNKNPGLCLRELATLADISQTTMSNRLKIINSNGERAKYVSKKQSKSSPRF